MDQLEEAGGHEYYRPSRKLLEREKGQEEERIIIEVCSLLRHHGECTGKIDFFVGGSVFFDTEVEKTRSKLWGKFWVL